MDLEEHEMDRYMIKQTEFLRINDLIDDESTDLIIKNNGKEYSLAKLLEDYRLFEKYYHDPKIETFKCYEIHPVQSRMFGCGKQCNECKEQEMYDL